jgi:hypothetical protein
VSGLLFAALAVFPSGLRCGVQPGHLSRYGVFRIWRRGEAPSAGGGWTVREVRGTSQRVEVIVDGNGQLRQTWEQASEPASSERSNTDSGQRRVALI